MSNGRSPFPDQPLVVDPYGVVRFMENRMVSYLLDAARRSGVDLDALASMRVAGHFTDAEAQQLSQLIGYSVSGYGELSYVNEEDLQRVDEAVERRSRLIE